MTDTNIIHALQCCGVETNCRNCPLYEERSADCIYTVLKNALDLITRQQAEIENLKVENQSLRGAANSLKMHYEEAQAEIERLKSCVKSEDEVREIAKRTMEPLVKEITREQIDIAVKYAKSEAYKECIEKVKEKANKCFASRNGVVLEETTNYNISKIALDSLVKMVGDDNA